MSSRAIDISEEIGCDDWMLLTYIHDRKEGETFEDDDFKTVEEDDASVEDHEDDAHYVVIHMTKTDEEQDVPKTYKNYYKVLEEDDGNCAVVYMATTEDETDETHYKNDYSLSMSSIGKLTGYESYESYEDFALVYESIAQCKGFAEAYNQDYSGTRKSKSEERMNAKARAQLLLQLDRNGPLFMMVRHEPSAYKMWKIKQSFYTPTEDADTVLVKEDEWTNCKIGRATNNPSKYMETICYIANDIERLDADYKKTPKVIMTKIINGLPKKYYDQAQIREWNKLVRVKAVKGDKDMDIEEVIPITVHELKKKIYEYWKLSVKPDDYDVEQEEENHTKDNKKSKVAFNTTHYKKFKGNCNHCGKQGHKKADCNSLKRDQGNQGNKKETDKNDDKLAKVTCYNCQEKGHYSNKCTNEKKPRKDKDGDDDSRDQANITPEK